MKILNEKKYKFQCKQCYTEILFSKKDCWVDVTYEDFWLTCPVCGSQHNNQTYGLFLQEYKEDIVDKDKEIERLNNIINELEKHCETMLSIFEQMTDEQRQEQLDKYKIYDGFLRRLQELKGSDKMENLKELELINLKDELQELLEDGEDNQLLRDKIQELENELKGSE